MSRTATHQDQRRESSEQSSVESVVRRVGAIHVFAGLLGLLGPAVEGNDDRGLVNTEPGLFLGVVTVNGPHALLHVLAGAVGLRASRDADSARRYLRASSVFFGALAAVGWRRFGFERGVHRIGVLAVDGWGNLGHTIISAVSLYLSRSE